MGADPQELADFFSTMRAARDLGAHYARLERWATEGRVELIYLLAERLLDPQAAPEVEPWQRGAMQYQLVQQLALTPGQTQVETSARLALLWAELLEPASARQLSIGLAPLLASAQDQAVLLPLFERFGQDEQLGEFLLLLAQELVIRKARLNQQPHMLRLVERMRERRHPLASLPLALVEPAEREVPGFVPRYVKNSVALPRPLRWAPSRRPSGPGQKRQPRDITTPALGEQIAAAVQSWARASNGRVEARAFELDRPLQPAEVGVQTLRSLELAALRGASKADIKIELLDGAQAFCALFVSASNGGASGSGLGGAYGRLAAWRSLAALAGVEGGDAIDFETVARRADECAWFLFRAPSEWFNTMPFDLGLLALRPGRRELAVLAATDQYDPD